jgi:pimeloyl-ACP methyl ester carboxylesterase
MSAVTETKYARSGDVHIAYQVVGAGALDLIFVPGWVSNLEMLWRQPELAHFIRRLATFSRIILFDKRGTGLSDRVSGPATLEQRIDDLHAVMEAVGSKSAALCGVSEGGPMACLFAATYPERTRALVLYGTYVKWLRDPDFPNVPSRAEHEQVMQLYEKYWGKPFGVREFAPSRAEDPVFREWWAAYLRSAASPGAAVALHLMNIEIDIRELLPAIRVPTLVMHRADDHLIPVDQGRYLAAHIPNAKYVELPGADHLIFVGDAEPMLDAMEEFLTGTRLNVNPDRAVNTILFTDIVGSTQKAAEMGSERWGDLVQAYFNLMRRKLNEFQGREVHTTGDGILAIFDGPARAVRCGCAISEEVRSLGIEIRVGMHTGEYEIIGHEIAGVAIHIAARVMAKAEGNQVWVSSTVKDLIAGSGIEFEDRGRHTLKGVPGEWHLYQAANC